MLLLSITFLVPSAWAQTITLKIGHKAVRAEVANTPETRRHGLMQRKKLCPDCGMLFVFSYPDVQEFWMKNTLLPLSVAFISADGAILNIKDMQPKTTNTHASSDDVLYALEISQGWFARNGIKPGSVVQGLQLAPYGH